MTIAFRPGVEPQPGSGVSSSRESLAAEKFTNSFAKKHADIESPDFSESAVRTFVEANTRLLMPGVTVEQVMAELKKRGFIKEPEKVKPVKPVEEVVMYRAESTKLSGIKEVEDEELKKILEENKFAESIEKDIFKNDADLDSVYQRSLLLGSGNKNETVESSEYYYSFAHLVKGGVEEIKKDLESLQERKDQFAQKTELLEPAKAKKTEQAKKVATIVERAVVHCVTNLEWYGHSVSIEPTSQFDDVKRGVDDVLQIQKEGESAFLGLGIDVTYRGLLSNQYREKLFTLLKSIHDGHRTKIKYFKNHEGELMKEFSVPKIILFFDMKDVKDLVYMIKNIDTPEIMEDFKNSPQKVAVMNQMVIQCELLADFAESCQNPIFQKYQDIVGTIKEISWKNSDIKSILDIRHEDEVTRHVKYLIEEFKSLNS